MSKVMNFVPRSLLIFSALFLIGVIWIAEATAQKVRVAMPAKSSVERLSDWIQDTVQGVVENRFLKPAQHQLAVLLPRRLAERTNTRRPALLT
jgi:hypothetical protein